MEFLKAILGDELYAQLEQAVNAYNGKPENAQNQVKIANLSGGQYVSKGKYDTLDATNKTNEQKLGEANNLIKQLQEAAKGDETLQQQVTEYQTKVQTLEAELQQTKIDAAIKVGLLAEGADEVEFLTFKLKSTGDKLELDEQGNIKGWADKVAALKTQNPKYFADNSGGSYKGFRPVDKEDPPAPTGKTKADILKMPYAERVKFYNENPDAYNEIMKG